MKLPIYFEVDNHAAVDLVNGWSIGGGTKHMEVRVMFIRELKESGDLKVKWVSTHENEADIFTKNVDKETFEKHVSKMMRE